ncbi:MAG TPA: pilin [Candidatus Saccharimonadales bacterium]|nr:pilin [Candidatus Saccharimonadales bacterium]
MIQQIKRWLGIMALSFLLALGLGVPAFAQTAQQQIDNGLCTGSNLQFTDNPTDQCAAAGSDANSQINNIVHTIVNILSAVVGIVAVIMIIVGGFRYITSGGNDTSVTAAKNTILYAIIGLVVVALAQIIVRFTLSKLTNS